MDSIGATLVEQTADNRGFEPEYLFAEISTADASSLLLGIVYRPPHCGWLSIFEDRFNELHSTFLHSIVIGDFNVNMETDTFDSRKLHSFVDSAGLYLVPYEPTHRLRDSSTLIDLCMVDDRGKITDYGQSDASFLSAHDLIFVVYNINVERRNIRQAICRDFRNFEEDNFRDDILRQEWAPLFSSDNIHNKVEILTKTIQDVLNRHAPLKQVRFRHAPAPWLTVEIRSAMRDRDRARRAWRRRRDGVNHEHFRKLRNRVQEQIRAAKCKYYQDLLGNSRNPNTTWSALRQLGLVRVREARRLLPCSITELNEFFAGCSTVLRETERAYVAEPPDSEFDDNQFFWAYISPSEIATAARKSKSNSAGVDGLSLRILKLLLPTIMPILEHICNFSFMHGIFPVSWKSAIVCPIPKVRNPSSAREFRPISVLPVLSKVLERNASDQVQNYLESNELYDPCQFAFRRGHSTQSSLIRVLDDVRSAIDKRQVTIAVFFDLSKAFDRIDHHILLGKLKTLRFSRGVIGWFKSYLTGRCQAVRDPTTGELSAWAFTNAGVPQGFVLGPTLFALYIGDIGNVIRDCSYSVYANDLVIYRHCAPRDIRHGIEMINSEIERILSWAELNKLTFNAGKTKAMVMGTSRYVNRLRTQTLPEVMVDGSIIPFTESTKYLGITLTSTLSWNLQVEGVVGKMRRALHQLKLCRELLPVELRGRLVSALIFPHLDYCCVGLTDITATLNDMLQKALNNCVRFIFGIRRDIHITPHLRRLRWLRVEVRRRYFLACSTYDIIQHQRPILLYGKLKFRTDITDRSTRAASDLLRPPQCRTEAMRKSFLAATSSLWNNLPPDVRRCRTLPSFRGALYEHLLGPS